MPSKSFRLTLVSAVVSAMTLCAVVAEAATFNFVDVADKNSGSFATTSGTTSGGEGDWGTIVGDGVGLLDSGSGISVVGSATNSAGSTVVDAYFDKGSAGLGVCSGFSGSQCSPSNDDNVGAIGGSGNVGDGSIETLVLTFSQEVSLDEIIFAGEGHGDFNGSVKVNGNPETPLSNALMLGLVGTIFEFEYIPQLSGVGNEFYIESVTVSAVPLPAALPLFLSMLAGMGALRWWRNKSVV